MSKYVITGTLRNGRRFKPIYTDTPWHYNIWCGTVWRLDGSGKRKMVKRIYNWPLCNLHNQDH